MNYDELLNIANKENIEVFEIPFNGQAKGYYLDGFIALNSRIETNTEKRCLLAEELGHHYTTSLPILDKSIVSVKQEISARRWACQELVRIIDLIDAFNHGITGRNELAEYLDVTVNFLEDTIDFYRKKYGTHFEIDNYLITFEPNLSIIKIFKDVRHEHL